MAKFAPLNMSPEEIIEYTPEWDGERFADGRPRVPDDLLERMVRFHPAGRRAHGPRLSPGPGSRSAYVSQFFQ